MIVMISLTATKLRAAEAGGWVSARSENFNFVGHVSARELREFAASLEEFRAVFQQILPREYFESGQPITVVVFASDDEYTSFKPLREGQPDTFVAGYFKAGSDLNYITLASHATRDETTSVLFHEYVHSLVRNRYGRAPLWLDEGLAEYYSAYALANGGRQLRYGELLPRRAQALRGRATPLLPLTTLLSADRYSPLYGDHNERGIFYAQSWALAHYLLSDRTGARERQLAKYLQLAGAGAGANVGDAIRQSFQVSPATLESRLAQYIREGAFEGRVETLSARVEPVAAPPVRELSEAETQARLGDLLLHTERLERAEDFLNRSLALDPDVAVARLSLGLLRLRQGRAAEAIEQLRRAAELDPQSPLAHYYYAGALDSEGSEAEFTVAGYAARGTLIRSEVKRAIELAPDFLDAQALLVLTDIERNPNIDEATALLERLMKIAPARREFKLLRAQLDLRKENFDVARAELRELYDDPFADPVARFEARGLPDTVSRRETLAAERREESGGEASKAEARSLMQPCDMPEPGPQLKLARYDGEQACGRLLKIECEGEGVELFVRSGERTLRLRTASLGAVRFVTYTSGIRGTVECGERRAPELVLVTYKRKNEDGQAGDGELKAVEFVPEDWIH
jgi:tetratricopeptide (TPR) repeat protein